ncbi:aminodeoxychorismate lyase [Nocardioides sp. Root1257]|uniref:endolytic transglycosylase MltG n=1 Tax=unclassified Nocardioides TaxID=2615069 RepID=UPI0006FC2935|nr:MULTISPECIES: endolytic transglycosylase MltG [unclassified Nocardioides]KQW43059.1 aminodeoxychorismate lyase [Nocardioides sp. Root1257]KRC41927.1 aminodeoxychorismate lyase [Nocardioides sp. Root224]
MTDEYDADHESAPLLDDQTEDSSYEGGRRRGNRRRGLPGCLAVLLALAVIAGGVYFVGTWAVDKIGDQFSSAEDYPGPGHGKVTFQVSNGDTVSAIGRNLKAQGVVASVEAFIDAANGNPDSNKIQAGYFPLHKEMASKDVVEVLVDPSNMVKSTVTIPEGLRVDDTVAILAKKTKFKKAAFEKVLDDPSALGLPDYAEGNPEGYLFPATYDFGPDATPESMLKAMVTRWRQAADDADLENAAADLGYTPQELMTVASLVQAEGRGDDMPKIARVIYNRLEIEPNPAAGYLQIDASVNYALDRPGIAVLTQDQIESVADSPYNTYKQKGLPPAPIESPGDDAIAAAAHPVDGPWFFYVTVNLKTGETKFTDDYNEFLQFKQELKDYCANESGGAC